MLNTNEQGSDTAKISYSAALVGAVLGIIILSVLRALADYIFFREATQDGLYILIYLATIPPGAILGASAGLGYALLKSRKTLTAGVCCCGIGGVVAVPFGLWALGAAQSPLVPPHSSPELRNYFISDHYWNLSGYLLPFICAMLLILCGLLLIAKNATINRS